MTIYAWPDDLGIESMEWGMERATVRLDNPMTKAVQVVDLLSYQWVVQAGMPPRAMFQAGKLEALMNTLVGGVDRVTLYRKDRPVPMGTLRGSPTLASSVAQFADTLVLANCVGTNLLKTPSFEDDGNSDGLANDWSLTTVGTPGAVNKSLTTSGVIVGSRAQLLQAPSVSGPSTIAVEQAVDLPDGAAGSVMSLSALLSSSGVTARLFVVTIRWLTAGGGVISTDSSTIAPVDGNWYRHSLSATAPPTARKAVVGLGLACTSTQPLTLYIDAAQFQVGSVTEFSGGATVKAGDMLGVSPQLFQVREDAVANDAGQMTVKLANRTRSSLAGGLPVVWDRPTATFVMEDDRSAFTFARMHMDRSTYRFREAP